MLARRPFGWGCADSWKRLRSQVRRGSDVRAVLEGEFDGVVGFHACRPHSVQALLQSGLLGHDASVLRKQAHAIFSPAFDAMVIDASFDGVTRGRHDLVYLALDERTLLGDAAHYLLYGSEQLCAVAAGLDRGDSDVARRLLLRRGTPAVVKCAVPWSAADGVLGSDALGDLAQAVAEEVAADRGDARDFTFVVNGRVMPGWIVGHDHAARLFDQINGWQWRDLMGTPCDACDWSPFTEVAPEDTPPGQGLLA